MIWSVLAVILLALVCVGSLIDVIRRPRRWSAICNERLWLKVMAWSFVLTAAALIGAVAGRATDGSLRAVLAAALALLYVTFEFWIDTTTGGSWLDRFR